MKSKFWILGWLFCLVAGQVNAQIEIRGTVVDGEDGSNLPGVMVVLKEQQKKSILRYAQTDAEGRFVLPLHSEQERSGCILHVSSLGYKSVELPLAGAASPLVIRLSPAGFQLNEVAVKAQKIRQQGDTLTYNVASFSDRQDKTIGDVLQKMPGITVASSGAISYNGVSINRFYIEGKDLLEGQYGIATNGISPADVGSVEIMEDHQPIRALQGMNYSSQAAVNLRLKQNSKAKWILNLLASGGYSSQPEGGLWAGEIFAMRMKGQNQNITLYKTNNFGKDLSHEVSDLTGASDPMGFSNYLRVDGVSVPDLEKKRTLFNRSHLFSTNQLLGLKNGWEAKLQVNWLNDRGESASLSEVTYYLPDREKVILEEREALDKTNHLFARLSVEANKETFYLKNELKTNLEWNDLTARMTGTLPNVQDASLPVYRLTNDFQLIKRWGNRIVTFYSYNDWQNRPQRLLVMGSISGRQQVRESGFFTHEHASYGWKIGRVTLSAKAGVKALFRGMNSRLTDVPDTLGVLVNDLTTNYANLYAVPQLEYKYRRWEGLFEVPLQYYRYDFAHRLSSESDWMAAPSLRIRWKPNSRLTFSVRGSIRPKECDIRSLYDGLVLTDYRNLQQGVDEYTTDVSRSLMVSLNYRNPSRGLFGNLMATRSWSESDFMGSSLFVGDYLLRSYVRRPGESRVWTVLGGLGSNVDFLRGTTGVNLVYQKNDHTMLSEGTRMEYASRSLSATFRMNGRVGECFNWQYRAVYGLNRMDVEGNRVQDLDQWRHNFSLSAFPVKSLQLQVAGEYYKNEVAAGKYKDLTLMDAKLAWNVSRSLELSATLSNLFNHRTYGYTLYSDLSSTAYEYRLRGREFLISIYWKK